MTCPREVPRIPGVPAWDVSHALALGGPRGEAGFCERAGKAGAPGHHGLFPGQELEQQLLMEKRNHRKTLKFYQKLLQKEKRSKGSGGWAEALPGAGGGGNGLGPALWQLCPPPGSEVKTMLSKLRGQLEEMKCKVQFLGLVKKYLQASLPGSLTPPRVSSR